MSGGLGGTPFKPRGDYEDVCCRPSALGKRRGLASWPTSSGTAGGLLGSQPPNGGASERATPEELLGTC